MHILKVFCKEDAYVQEAGFCPMGDAAVDVALAFALALPFLIRL